MSRPLRCSSCGEPIEAAGYYCRACRAAYMRRWRQRAKEARLHAVVRRTLSRVSRETGGAG
jgi:predicted amidophosphoribosyltransferase